MGVYGDWAEKYLKAGFSPIPVNGKDAFTTGWSKYSESQMDEDEFDTFVKKYNDYNFGIVLGKSTGIVGIDIDYLFDKPFEKFKGTKEDYDLIKQTIEAEQDEIKKQIVAMLPNTPCVKIGKEGKATYFYKAKGNFVSKAMDRNGIRMVDVLWDKRQTVLPPSIHPETKKPYRWINGDLTKHVDDLPELDWSIVQEIERKFAGNFVKTNREIVISGRNDLLKKSAIGFFRRGLKPDVVADLLYDFDILKNSPPLFSDREDFPKTYKDPKKSALKFASSIYESFLKLSLTEPPGYGHENERDYKHSPQDKNIKLVALNDLLNRPDENIDYLVENLLPAGGTSIVAAKPKCGKTTLLRQLSLCVSRGELFLTRRCSQGPVIYFSVEEKIDEIKRHFKVMGANGSEPIYIFADRAPKDTLSQLKPIIDEIKPSLIILDTLFKVIRMKDSNDYAAISEALEPVQELARESGAHIMCVHHAGKADRDGADGILGSTAILAAFDTAIMMNRSGEKRTIKSIQRYGTDMDESTLIWDKTTRRSELGQADWKAKAEARTKEVLDFVRQAGKASFSEIKNFTLIDRDILRDTLKNMVEKRQLFVTGRGTKGDPHMYSTIGII